MALTWAWGQVQGHVVTVATDLLEGEALRFRIVLEDSSFGERVDCCLPIAHSVDGLLGETVLVEGYVGRDQDNGHVRRVNRITKIEVLEPPEPGEYKQARGLFGPPDEPAEVSIRRIREDWTRTLEERIRYHAT